MRIREHEENFEKCFVIRLSFCLLFVLGIYRGHTETNCPKAAGRCFGTALCYMERRRGAEQYNYQIGKINFIVTPVYKDGGEPMRDILLKLMLADLERGDILNKGGGRRYNRLGNTDCLTPEEGGQFETVW